MMDIATSGLKLKGMQKPSYCVYIPEQADLHMQRIKDGKDVFSYLAFINCNE